MFAAIKIVVQLIMALRNYRDLRVWNASVELTLFVYSLSAAFPKQEIFGITAQMRHAAVSVASNIAEGNARSSTREFLRFLAIARGSLAELDTQITIIGQLGYAKAVDIEEAMSKVDLLARMVKRLEQVLHRRLSSADP